VRIVIAALLHKHRMFHSWCAVTTSRDAALVLSYSRESRILYPVQEKRLEGHHYI